MTGYVKVYKPELKIKDYEAYRGIYCTLCRTLGKEYGQLSRMLLSYDLTFLLIVLLSVSDIKVDYKNGRCPFNPSKKCNYCKSAQREFSFAAAVTVLMFYYKVKDNLQDGSLFERILMYIILPYAALKRKKALKKYKDLDETIAFSMMKQKETEDKNSSSIDEAAHNSADALGKIFTYHNNSQSLYRFGYLIGRWVYLTDAADDIEKDIKNNSYNVFVNKYSLTDNKTDEEIKTETEETLFMTQAAVIDAFEKLPVSVFKDVIENIIYDSFTKTTSDLRKENKNYERSL